MAVDIREILAEGMLKLCETEHLQDITIKELLVVTHVARQSFYNWFRDRNDLIQYIYNTRIIPDFNSTDHSEPFRERMLRTFENMRKYSRFMKEAILMDGQNNLRDYMSDHCKTYDLQYHQQLYGSQPMPETLKFATEYHAMASSSMTLSWILSDMPASCEEMADLITQLRGIGMEKLFAQDETKGNPYL
ncbi:MAG: TetR/AcrR family transcriptional regulator C-terminal domain-containing protein [Bulleidia sp.]